MAMAMVRTKATRNSSGRNIVASQALKMWQWQELWHDSGKNTATLAQAPAQSFVFAAECSSLQLVSDGDGSMLQLQKRQLKDQCSRWQLIYCHYH